MPKSRHALTIDRMPTRAVVLAAAIASVSCLCADAALAQTAVTPVPIRAAKPKLMAARRVHPIKLDGALDEQDWSLAGVATDFTQRFPDPGKPATYQTEVRILYDDD